MHTRHIYSYTQFIFRIINFDTLKMSLFPSEFNMLLVLFFYHVYVVGAGDGTQGFTHAGQMPYH